MVSPQHLGMCWESEKEPILDFSYSKFFFLGQKHAYQTVLMAFIFEYSDLAYMDLTARNGWSSTIGNALRDYLVCNQDQFTWGTGQRAGQQFKITDNNPRQHLV